jgi:hypothetical protein
MECNLPAVFVENLLCEGRVFGNPQNYVSLRNDIYFISSVRLLPAFSLFANFVSFYFGALKKEEASFLWPRVWCKICFNPTVSGEEGKFTGVVFDIQIIKSCDNIIRLITYFFDF